MVAGADSGRPVSDLMFIVFYRLESFLVQIFGEDVCWVGDSQDIHKFDLFVPNFWQNLAIEVFEFVEAALPGNADSCSGVGANPKIDSFSKISI